MGFRANVAAALAMAVLAVALSTTAASALYGESIARSVINASIGQLKLLGPTELLVSATSPQPSLYYLRLNKDIRIIVDEMHRLPLPAAPSLLDASPIGGETYAAALLPNGQLVLAKLPRFDEIMMFDTAASPLGLVVTRSGVVALSSAGGESILYIVRPGRLGWTEARVNVGSMLADRVEAVRPVALVKVRDAPGSLASSYALLVYELVPLPRYTVLAKLYVATGNGTVPASRATIMILDANNTAVLGDGAVDENGTAEIRLTVSPLNTTLNMYVSFNGSCYSLMLKPDLFTPNGPRSYIVRKRIVLTPDRAIPFCPRRPTNVLAALLAPSENGLKMTTLPLNITDPGAVRVLDAYMYRDRLYLWLAGRIASALDISGLSNCDTGFAYIALQEEGGSYHVVDAACYRSPVQVTAFSSNGVYAALASTRGDIYVARSDENGRYRLLWATLSPAGAGTPIVYVSGSATNTTFMASSRGVARVALFKLLSTAPETPLYQGTPPTYSIDTTPWSVTDAAYIPGTLYLASTHGLVVADNIAVHSGTNISLKLSNISISPRALRIVDFYTRKPVAAKVSYTLLAPLANGTEVVVEKGVAEAHDGEVGVPCGPGLTASISIEPVDRIHEAAGLLLECSSSNTNTTAAVVELRRRTGRLLITMYDAYTGAAPETNLTIIVNGTSTNTTMIVNYTAGQKLPLELTLPMDTYTIRIVDTTGLYRAYTATVNLEEAEKELVARLDRIDVPVQIIVSSRYSPKPNDIALIRVYTANGSILYSGRSEAPTPGKSVTAVFTTKYRGPARLEVGFIPSGDARAPFYRNITIEFNVTNQGARLEVSLRPALYELRLSIVAGDTGAPLESRITLLRSDGQLVTSAKATGLTARLIRGTYIVKVEPPPLPGMNISLYGMIEKKVNVGPDVALTLRLPRLRYMVPVELRDPYSPKNTAIDDITVYVDGYILATVAKGKPLPKLSVPALVNGSKLVVEAAHGLYKKLEVTVKPGKKNETQLYTIDRKTFPVTFNVVNDVGEGVGGAMINVTGLDLEYLTTLVTGPDGKTSITLPYGTYEACFKAAGYVPACTTVKVTGPRDVTQVLQPLPLTLVKRFMPLIIAIVVAVVLVVVVRSYFRRLVERLAGEEEF